MAEKEREGECVFGGQTEIPLSFGHGKTDRASRRLRRGWDDRTRTDEGMEDWRARARGAYGARDVNESVAVGRSFQGRGVVTPAQRSHQPLRPPGKSEEIRNGGHTDGRGSV